MPDRTAVVLDAHADRRTVVGEELRRHGHDVRIVDDVRSLLASTVSTTLFLVGVHEDGDDEIVSAVRSVPGGEDAVIVAIMDEGAHDVGRFLRAGASDVWVVPSQETSLRDVPVRLALAEHYARLQVEHARVGGELSVLKKALDLSGTGFVLSDPGLEDNPIVYVNRSFIEMTGYRLADCLGRNCRFLQGDDVDQDGVREMAEAVAAERPASVTIRNYRRDGTRFLNEVHIAPVRDDAGRVVRFVGVQIDATDQQATGARLALEQQARQRAERERRRTAIIAAGTASMDRADDEDGVLRALRTAVEDLLGPETSVDVEPGDVPEGDSTWIIHAAEEEEQRGLVLDHAPAEDDRTAVDLLVERTEDALARVGARAAERGLIRAMRETLRPLRPVEIDGLDVAVRVVPAGPGLAVGGDFAELVRFADQSEGVVLGDVTGQGPRAAALTGLVRHTVRACALVSSGPAQTLGLVNQLLLEVPDRRRYCALALVQASLGTKEDLESDTWTMRVALAGSPIGMLVDQEGRGRPVAGTGTLLGASAEPAFEDHEVLVEPGCTLTLFTDGVTDPLGGGTAATGVLVEQLPAGERGASALVDDVLAIGEAGAVRRPDDRAVLALRVPPSA